MINPVSINFCSRVIKKRQNKEKEHASLSMMSDEAIEKAVEQTLEKLEKGEIKLSASKDPIITEQESKTFKEIFFATLKAAQSGDLNIKESVIDEINAFKDTTPERKARIRKAASDTFNQLKARKWDIFKIYLANYLNFGTKFSMYTGIYNNGDVLSNAVHIAIMTALGLAAIPTTRRFLKNYNYCIPASNSGELEINRKSNKMDSAQIKEKQ